MLCSLCCIVSSVASQLLGSPSNDIDIALDSMMGVPFAENLVEFCSKIKNVEVAKIAKIESNPDQSKHLETARTNLLGLELDFVNLRSEQYAEGSRIPTQVVSALVSFVAMTAAIDRAR